MSATLLRYAVAVAPSLGRLHQLDFRERHDICVVRRATVVGSGTSVACGRTGTIASHHDGLMFRLSETAAHGGPVLMSELSYNEMKRQKKFQRRKMV